MCISQQNLNLQLIYTSVIKSTPSLILIVQISWVLLWIVHYLGKHILTNKVLTKFGLLFNSSSSFTGITTHCGFLAFSVIFFHSALTQLSPPSYSHYLFIFFNVLNPSFPWSSSVSPTYWFPLQYSFRYSFFLPSASRDPAKPFFCFSQILLYRKCCEPTHSWGV